MNLLYFCCILFGLLPGDQTGPMDPQTHLTKLNHMNQTTVPPLHYLALGDSYTIGEQVAPAENFPNQLAALLSAGNREIIPRIIATTGWTTDELMAGILAAHETDPLPDTYDLVSLLIGVNNQYRGRTPEDYEPEFEGLLQKAIRLAGNQPGRVVVLSIPDWGVTPFAEGHDRARIAREIDAYNTINKRVSERYHIHYIDITPWTREAAGDPSLLAADGLHPSGREYQRWANMLADWFKAKI